MSGELTATIDPETFKQAQAAFKAKAGEGKDTLSLHDSLDVLAGFEADLDKAAFVKTMQQQGEDPATMQLDFERFLSLLCQLSLRKTLCEEDLKLAFELFDANGDGQVTIEELRDCLEKYAPDDFDEHNINGLIEFADIDGDGVLSYEEFIHSALDGCAKDMAYVSVVKNMMGDKGAKIP